MYWPEKYQLGFVRKYLHEKEVEFVTEPYLFSIPIDILGVRDGEVFAVELKTKNFKKGIAQADRNRSFADYSYLSVWEKRVTEGLISRIEEKEVGLLSIGERVKCLSPPNKNQPSDHAKIRAMEEVIDNVRKHSPIQQQWRDDRHQGGRQIR